MSQPPEEDRFSRNATIMAQAVQEGVQNLYDAGYQTVSPVIVSVVAAVISSFDKKVLIEGFIDNSYRQCWEKIRLRDEVFFVENASQVFQYLPVDKVNLFKDLFTTKDKNGNSVVPEDIKDQVWNLFDSMIKISIKYVSPLRDYDTDLSWVADNSLLKSLGWKNKFNLKEGLKKIINE